MKARSFGGIWAAVLAIGWIAGAANADFTRRGEGILRDVDASSLTVRVRRTTLKIGPGTEILDPLGNRLAISELLDREGDPVRYRAGGGTPHPILESIVVEDPEGER